MSRRAALLEFAVLGLLHESPMHGYELRKRLNLALGPFRALSYGTLYPCLKVLLADGLIEPAPGEAAPSTTPRKSGTAAARGRNVYALTPAGQQRFREQVNAIDATAYQDEVFDVRLAFFARTEADVRMRILEGRRSVLESQLATLRATRAKNRQRWDTYTSAMQRHGEDQTEREVRWLTELIDLERQGPARRNPLTDPSHPAYNPPA